MSKIKLYTFGRKTTNGAWRINKNRVVNRLYYVNSGTAVIHNTAGEFTLREKRFYIIPQCFNFKPLAATDFDHTFFDYYSTPILHPDKIYEFSADFCQGARFFEYVNALIENGDNDLIFEGVGELLSGFLSVLLLCGASLSFVENSAVVRAVEIINNSLSPVTCKSLADGLHLNESYFIRLFHKTMGVSPMKYARACRILYAKELLSQGMSASQAAEKCGYTSVTAFYRAVRREGERKPKKD